MTTIEIINRETHAAAIARAQAERPHVSFISFGSYNVTGRDGRTQYRVTFRKEDTRKLASCTCKSTSKAGCFHIFSGAITHHIMLARQKAQEAANAVSYAECATDGPVVSEEPHVPVLPEKPASLTERIARDRTAIATMRTRLNLPGPVIRTFASVDEARQVAVAANADLFG